MNYVLSIDQSTQSTKAILFDEEGMIVKRVDRKHRQIINELGYISHDPIEIYENTLAVVKELITFCGVQHCDIKALGISNQRETTLIWDDQGTPLSDAVVWQCSRSSDIVQRMTNHHEEIYEITGLVLSPYFPASKMRWLIESVKPTGSYHIGTMDSWLLYRLTNNKVCKTDASNASRTQLFDIHTGTWSKRLCDLFEIDMNSLPEVCDSNAFFGTTDFDGFLDQPIPILSVMGDSHAALYGQGCHKEQQVKVTLGTGSSIMMNIGHQDRRSKHGLTTSLAWRINGQMSYVWEGNINYTGAVISWLQHDLGLIADPNDTITAIQKSNPKDETILIPAFSGLSAPYWNEQAKGMFYGMSRTTTKNELIKAGVESIAYQIHDVLDAMAQDCRKPLLEVKTDGGPSKNTYLMQFLSDLVKTTVLVSTQEELSAIGVAYMAGIQAGIYKEHDIFTKRSYITYETNMKDSERNMLMDRWKKAIRVLLK